MNNGIDCVCQSAGSADRGKVLTEFERLRDQCDALKTYFVPDEIYGDWKNAEQCLINHPQNDSHRSVLTLALERGRMGRVTSPVHRYLLKNSVSVNYKNAFRETWLFKSSPVERHGKSRMYMGKLMELKVAECLEDAGWKITNLEAWGGSFDIEAEHPKGSEQYCLEVKYIGQENDDFLQLLKSLGGEGAIQQVSPYIACNYALFRIYEASKQLEKCRGPHKKAVALVIDQTTWYRFEIPLKEKWIKERGYTFNLDSESVRNDCAWQLFFNQTGKKKYPQVETEISQAVCGLDEIKILTFGNWELDERLTDRPKEKHQVS